MKIKILTTVLAFCLFSISFSQEKSISLFNGKDLKNWLSPVVPSVFTIEDNAIVSQGKSGALFFNGKDKQFQNFVLSCDIKTQPEAIAEIIFHTDLSKGQEIPKGYSIRIQNTYKGANSGENIKLTGSIDRIRNVYFPFIKDQQWFNLKISVLDKEIKVFLNNIQVASYTEPSNPWRPEDLKNRLLSSGTVGIRNIQGKVSIKNIQLIPQKNELVAQTSIDREYDKKITQLHAANFPLIDFHVHLKGGLTLEDAVIISQNKGINYGIAANCGLRFPVTNNGELNAYMNSIENAAIYRGMQAEGREWMTLFSPDTAARFDYIFTDAMTWTNNKGFRMRLWIKEETEVGDPNMFMDELVSKIEQILKEPIDIYVNPTFIPEEIAARYNELWTTERMDRVINALVKNDVALEINARYKIPGIEFIKKAKQAGVKFSFGTNNLGKDDLNYDYCFEVLDEVGLTASDMWMPRKQGTKKIQKL